MRKPYKVFVSSTYRDNATRRDELFNVIIRAEMLPVGMEYFTATTKPVVQTCLDHVDDCDVFLGILGWRYGWEPTGDKSITQLEYERAKDKPRLMFVIEGDDFPPSDAQDTDEGDFEVKIEKLRKLRAFKAAITETPARFNERSLTGQVADALRAWRDTQQPAAPPPSVPPLQPNGASSAVLTNYLADIRSQHSHIELVGFEHRIRAPLRLEDLHVELRASYNLHDCGTAFLDGDHADEMMGRRGQAEIIELRDLFQQAIRGDHLRCFVLLGDPGSGKTTHLRHLALVTASNGANKLGLPADTIPVFLPLRELETDHRDFDAFAQARLSRQHPTVGDVTSLLRQRRLLFLIDGLDEVPQIDRRAQVAKWIAELGQRYSEARVVLTCRYAGYNDDVRMPASFCEMHLRPLTKEQADRFVHNWYEIVETSLGNDASQAAATAKQRADELCERLGEGGFRTARVATLTGNPLLLTTLCLVHRDRGSLPEKRHKLYEDCVVLLLDLWARKGRELNVTFKQDEARTVLQPMAYWLHREQGRTRASGPELAPILDPYLAKLDAGELTAERFLETIKNESGLVTGWSHVDYGFLHLAFQEYLTAIEIRNRFIDDNTVLDDLAAKFGDSWWREVCSLLVALPNPSLFRPFFERVVELPAFAKDSAVVDDCLADAVEVVTDPFETVLAADPGDDEGLWARQLAALRVVQGHAPEKVDALRERLNRHPMAAIREQFIERPASSAERMVSARGDYELVRISGGRFWMGSSPEEITRLIKDHPNAPAEFFADEGPQNEVELGDFYLGVQPVTNAQYEAFLRANPGTSEPSEWANKQFNAPEQPVVGVSWHDARAYCEWAGLCLPTEAQWEYACRAGTTTRYWSGGQESDLARVGWYRANSDGRPHPAGEKPANPWGLHDMHGNVFEWCEDGYGPYSTPARPGDGLRVVEPAESRVIRGGSYWYDAGNCRSASRSGWRPGYRDDDVGFRPARVIT